MSIQLCTLQHIIEILYCTFVVVKIVLRSFQCSCTSQLWMFSIRSVTHPTFLIPPFVRFCGIRVVMSKLIGQLFNIGCPGVQDYSASFGIDFTSLSLLPPHSPRPLMVGNIDPKNPLGDDPMIEMC